MTTVVQHMLCHCRQQVLWMVLTSSCSDNTDVGSIQSAVSSIQDTWRQCSQGRFTFDGGNRWVVNVDIGCPSNCDGDLETARNIALNVWTVELHPCVA